MKRCGWVNMNNPEYIHYHDTSWWVVETDDKKLFEFLILEWAQAWLSWETVLKKRAWYKQAFWDFDIDKIITKLNEEKVEELMHFDGIIKNRLKIKSVKKNAIAVKQIQEEYGSFYAYLYSFMPDNKPIKNSLKTLADADAQTDISENISKNMKKRGMSFVWPTIIYAFMQAVWMVNDHTTDCFRYNQV